MSFDESSSRAEQFAELRSDVRHIQADVTELRAETRAANQRLDTLRDRVDQNAVDLSRRMDGMHADLRKELTDRIEKVDAKVESVRTDLSSKVDSVRTDLSGKVDSVRTDLSGKVDSVRTDLSGKVDSVRTDLSSRIDSVRTELTDRIEGLDAKIDSVKESLASAKIWAVMLYVALAGSLFFALAKGFKWI